MNLIRKTFKPMSVCLAVIMFLISAPVHTVQATMIGTERFIDSAHGREAREYLH